MLIAYDLETTMLNIYDLEPRINAFAKVLKSERLAKKLSVRQAARQARISHATFSRVENGYMPDMKTFYRLCYWGRFDIDRSIKQLLYICSSPTT